MTKKILIDGTDAPTFAAKALDLATEATKHPLGLFTFNRTTKSDFVLGGMMGWSCGLTDDPHVLMVEDQFDKDFESLKEAYPTVNALLDATAKSLTCRYTEL